MIGKKTAVAGRTLGRRFVTGAALFAVCAASQAAWAQKSPRGQAAYNRAQDHLAAQRFADAARELETAVRYEPRFAMGWYLLASASRRALHCDRAVAAYRRYMELRPKDSDPYFGAGLCLETVGARDAAALALRRYIESDGRPSSAQFVEIARKRLADIERVAATKKTASAPAAPAAASALTEARASRAQGRTDEAIARYRVAVGAARDAGDIRSELGAVLVAARRMGEAVVELREAVRLSPSIPQAWYDLAFALRETGDMPAAVDAYRRYITFNPVDPDPHYGLGRALAALGRHNEALTAFRDYITLETRPTERRWVNKARAEIARIEAVAPPMPTATATRPWTGSQPAGKAGTPVAAPSAAPAEPTPAGQPR